MISGIILASGFSRRMEQEKLTLQINEVSMVERVIQLVKASNLQEIILVYRREEIGQFAQKYNIKSVHNPYAHLGQSMSLKLGIKAANPKTEGYMFFVGDQPLLKVDFINYLIDEMKNNINTYPIIVPKYNGNQGAPVIFSSHLKEQLLSIEGDKGGRSLVETMTKKVKYINALDEKMGQDIDTWEIYQHILGNSKS